MRTMVAHTNQPWWLTLTGSIFGFDEGDEGGAGAGDGANQGGSGEGEENSGGADGGDRGTDDTAGLKSALQKERAERKKLEKDLRAFQKQQQTAADAEKTEVQRLTDENGRVADKAAKLAAGFKANAVETAILRAAGAAKFRDPSDALRSEVIAAIGVEQDDDDPTKVNVDATTVTEAIKALVKAKPHYIATDTPRPPKSGSTFGGTNNGKPQPDAEKTALQQKYPALRGL